MAMTEKPARRLVPLHEGALRRLARSAHGDGLVLSVYLSTDSVQVPAPQDQHPRLDSLLSAAERRHPPVDDHEQREALGVCLERAHLFLGEIEVVDHPVRGVALFCTEAGRLEAYGLQAPVDSMIAIGEAPVLEPLVDALPGPSWGVALISRDHARILRGTRAFLVEIAKVDDDVHRRHSQGGWSQARYQRGIEKETDDHVKHVCELLLKLHRRRPFDHLLVGGPSELWPVVDAALHPSLKERLRGHIAIDVRHPSPDDVLERAHEFMEDEDLCRERDAIATLEAGLGTGDQSVAGLSETLAALNDRRVGTLLVAEGFSVAGSVSPTLGQLHVEKAEAEEQADRRPVANVVELAIEAALRESAEVLIIHGDGLDSHGSIGALLRY